MPNSLFNCISCLLKVFGITFSTLNPKQRFPGDREISARHLECANQEIIDKTDVVRDILGIVIVCEDKILHGENCIMILGQGQEPPRCRLRHDRRFCRHGHYNAVFGELGGLWAVSGRIRRLGQRGRNGTNGRRVWVIA